jgi:hypothetical protein
MYHLFLFIICVLIHNSVSQCTVKIERISSPIFYVGKDHNDYYDSNYVGFKITNNSTQTLLDVWITLSLPSTQTLQLAAYETGQYRIGGLLTNSSQNAYFLLTGRTESDNNYTVVAYRHYPLYNEQLCNVTLTTTISHIIK